MSTIGFVSRQGECLLSIQLPDEDESADPELIVMSEHGDRVRLDLTYDEWLWFDRIIVATLRHYRERGGELTWERT